MNSPLLPPPRTLTLRDGRQLAFACYGASDGRPVHVLHGFPGSRWQAALLDGAARASGVCLVAADRPGFGASSPQPGRHIAGFADDLAQLADHLGHRCFAVLGISCGGPYALACAQWLPDRVERVGLLAGIGPMDIPALRRGQLPMLRLMFALARVNPLLTTPLLQVDRLLFRRDPQRALKALAALLTPPDQRLLASDPALRDLFAASLAEAYRPGIAGARCEVGLIARPHGIALESIRQPVDIYQSGQDRHVPPAMGRHLAQRLANARLHECPEEGHLSVVVHGGPAFLRDHAASAAQATLSASSVG